MSMDQEAAPASIPDGGGGVGGRADRSKDTKKRNSACPPLSPENEPSLPQVRAYARTPDVPHRLVLGALHPGLLLTGPVRRGLCSRGTVHTRLDRTHPSAACLLASIRFVRVVHVITQYPSHSFSPWSILLYEYTTIYLSTFLLMDCCGF